MTKHGMTMCNALFLGWFFLTRKKNLDASLLLKLIYIFCQVKGKKSSDFLTCYFSPFFAQWKKKSQEFTERHKKDSHEETLKCKLYVWWKKNPICQIFHQKSFTVWMRIDEIADVFLNSTNFSQHTLLTLTSPSTLNSKSISLKTHHSKARVQ